MRKRLRKSYHGLLPRVIVMTDLILGFLRDLLDQLLDVFSSVFLDMGNTAFYLENSLSAIGGETAFKNMLTITTTFGTSLAVVMLLKKGWYVYVLWRDGDAGETPTNYLQNFMCAAVIIIAFPTLYGWLVDLVTGLAENLSAAISSTSVDSLDDIVEAFTVGSAFPLVIILLTLIFVILMISLYFKFIMVGVELFLLRLGAPIAAAWLINNDGGIFKDYIQTLAESVITVSLQIILANIAISLAAGGYFGIFFSIGFASVAIKTPQFLQRFLVTRRGSGSAVGQAYHAVQLVKALK